MDDQPVRHRPLTLLHELTDRIAPLAQHAGLSVEDVQAAVQESISRRPDGGRPYPLLTDVSADHRTLGALFSLWRASAAYTDELGEPRPIPALGPAPSLQALFEQVMQREPDTTLTLETSIEHLLEYKSIEATDDGLYRPTLVAVIVSQSGAANPLVLLSYVVEFCDTIAHNLEQHNTGAGRTLFQAVSEVLNVPTGQIRVINGAVVQDAYRFLEQVDIMMEQAASDPDADGEPRQRMGVGVYLFGRPLGCRDEADT
jgi:hypothetical protein